MAKQADAPPDLNTQAGRLRWAREQTGSSSARAAAEEHGWPVNTYKSHEYGVRGANGIKPRYLEMYARAFNVDLMWLTYGKGSPKRRERTVEDLARELLSAVTPKR